MKELAVACQKAGLKLCFYYSQTQDWHEPDADGNTWDFPDESKKDCAKYLKEKAIPQVRELLTNYGPIGMIWFDTPRWCTGSSRSVWLTGASATMPAIMIRPAITRSASERSGPTSLGEIPPPSVERLAEVGKWMKVNRESIRGTVAGPFPYDEPWGVITSKPGKLYLHVFNWPGTELALYGLSNNVQHARLLAGGTSLTPVSTHWQRI